jgi:drug/metabolite transporter (DMT)-like permease
MNTKTLPVLVLLGVIYGSAFLYMKVLVDDLSATEIVAGRLFLGALTVVAIMLVLKRRPKLRARMLGAAAVLVILDSLIPHTLIAWAEVRIDSGVASVLISTMPMFTVLFATLTLPDERLSTQGLLGLGVGLIGVVVLTGGDIFKVSEAGTAGMLAVVGAAVSYAVAAIYAKMLLRTNDAIALTGTKLSLGAVMALGITFTLEGPPDYSSLGLDGSLAILALGILSTGIGFLLYFWLVTQAGTVYASLVTYIVPIAGLALGWIVLGEEIGPETLLGAALIAIGVAGVMHHPKQQPATEQPVPAPQLVLLPGEG